MLLRHQMGSNACSKAFKFNATDPKMVTPRHIHLVEEGHLCQQKPQSSC